MSNSLQPHSLSITNSQNLLKLMSIKLVMAYNHLILCRPFSRLHCCPASGSFPRRKFFTSGIQSIGVSASVLPMNIQDLFPLGLTGWSSLQSKGLSRVFPTTQFKSVSSLALSFIVQLSHPYMTTGKTIALTRGTFVGKVMSLLSRLVIAFLPRSKCHNFMAAVTICSDFGAPENKVSHCFHCFTIYLP